MMKKYSIGVDFGTLSARAVLVDIASGEICASSEFAYPHGVIEGRFLDGTSLQDGWSIQHPNDYLVALEKTVTAVMLGDIRPEQIVGIGTDFTSSTMVSLRKNGQPLCFEEEFQNNPYAYSILWKHHAAQTAANRINSLAEEWDEQWLARYGGKISAEWGVPKLLQICMEAPNVYENTEVWSEAADWVVWQLTGEESHSHTTLGFKTIWDLEEGFPSEAFFEALYPGFSSAIEKFGENFIPAAEKAGTLSARMAERLGLLAGTPVSPGMVDAYASLPAVGISGPGEMLLILGTSVCEILVESDGVRVPGLCGVVKDGILPNYYAHEGAQSAGGDIFTWFVTTCCGGDSDTMHIGLTEDASKLRPGENGLIALDWWNGNNCILDDMHLSGILFGLTLATSRAEIYRALLESVAFGTRVNVEQFKKYGISINKIVASGGISQKNNLLMQIYANVLDTPIHISSVSLGPALGSAMFGAVAAGAEAGGYDTMEEAVEAMKAGVNHTFYPNEREVEIYDRLYEIYRKLHDYFGMEEPALMYALRELKVKEEME
jgi:L-ribulokinase